MNTLETVRGRSLETSRPYHR